MKIQTIACFTLVSLLSTAVFAAAQSTQSTAAEAARKPGPMEHLQVWGTRADVEAEHEMQRQREALAQQVKREQLRALRLRQDAELERLRAETERAVAEAEGQDSLKAQEREAVRAAEEQSRQPTQTSMEEKAEEPT